MPARTHRRRSVAASHEGHGHAHGDVIGAACPTCGRVMELRAVVRGPDTGRVLAGLERAARGPPARAAVVARA